MKQQKNLYVLLSRRFSIGEPNRSVENLFYYWCRGVKLFNDIYFQMVVRTNLYNFFVKNVTKINRLTTKNNSKD